ncbi:hypothetical protein Barb6_03419 [Bacteroidales bacterium Barb6]|nr:hypothetical protein Barb6_03419 [Bacteroidales bacterium Barb6]
MPIKKIKKNTLTLFLLLACCHFSKGQDRIHILLNYNYLFGLHEKGTFWELNRSDSKMGGFEFSVTGMYDVNKRLSSVPGYRLKDCQTLGTPLFLFMHVWIMPFSEIL